MKNIFIALSLLIIPINGYTQETKRIKIKANW